MHPIIRSYVRVVDAVNDRIGRVVRYMIVLMIGLLLYAAVSRNVFNMPLSWGVEMSQFLLVAYYMLGAGHSMQLDSHVRMDLLYSRWRPTRRAFADTLTAFCLLAYLIILLIGGVSSTHYAVTHDQRNYSAWAPALWPIKAIMVVGIGLMLLQTVAIFFKDLARWRGEELR